MIKSFDEMTYYELLDVTPDASMKEIEESFHRAKSVYEAGSKATYGLFDPGEREEILLRIKEAYGVLINDQLRGEYDKKLMSDNVIPIHSHEIKRREYLTGQADIEIREGLCEDIDLDQYDKIDGSVLKQIRELKGIYLEEISQETKISVNVLNNIEANNHEKLPTPVYLKGFLREYARYLKIDHERVLEDYLSLYNQK